MPQAFPPHMSFVAVCGLPYKTAVCIILLRAIINIALEQVTGKIGFC
jgi:hypothetical protein